MGRRRRSRDRARAGLSLMCLAMAAAGFLVVQPATADAPPRPAQPMPRAVDCGALHAKGKVGASDGAGMLNLADGDLTRELVAARDAGVWAVRVDVDWSQIEASPGRRDWVKTDRIIAAVLAHGMCPHGLISYTPRWAANPADRPTSAYFRPRDPAVFAGFAKAAASRYHGRVAVWEIWNEPNTVTFFKPAPDPVFYGRLLAAAHSAIKLVDGRLTVVAGGLAPAVDNGRDIAPVTFLSKLYRNRSNRYFDAVAMHPYTYPALPNDPATTSWSAAQQMWPMRDIMVAGNDAHKHIWITECGAPTGKAKVAVTEAIQAQTIDIVLTAARDVPWLGPAFVYSIRDAGVNVADPEQNFGILRTDFTPKPAYTVVRRFGTANR